MIEYLHNPEFWNFKWTLRDTVPKVWLLVLAIALILKRFYRADHQKIIYFAAFTLFMEHASSDEDFQKLISVDKGTSPLYHLLTPFLFFFMTLIFADYLYSEKNRKWGILLQIAFVLLAIISALWVGIVGSPSVPLLEGLKTFPSISVGVYSMVGIMLSIGYFWHLLNKLEEVYLERLPMFWVSTGLLIYFSGNFLIWIGISFLNYDKEFFHSIYTISTILTLMLQCFLIVAIILNPKDDTPKITTIKA